MKILILGGTVFVGLHIVEEALARGHEVTLFNRGQQNRHLFPDVEKLRGDRHGDLASLSGRTFDAVLDTSGYTPRHVRSVVERLRNGIEHYTFVSSNSVYQRFEPGRRYDEDAPVQQGSEGYGALKARAEDELRGELADRVVCVRPGLIVGPHDPTDRFTYWPRRIAKGGRVLAPGRPQRPIQFIDVRDLARWCVQLAERRIVGAFHAIGPGTTFTMADLLDTCRAVVRSDAEFVWIDDDRLMAARVSPWVELPVWIPEAEEHFGGMFLADNRRAVAAGLSLRPVAETVAATFEWDRGPRTTHSAELPVTPLTSEREAELLAMFDRDGPHRTPPQ